jgi:hypothetical protein
VPFLVKSRRASVEELLTRYPGASVVDVTSRGPEPWVRFSRARLAPATGDEDSSVRQEALQALREILSNGSPGHRGARRLAGGRDESARRLVPAPLAS